MKKKVLKVVAGATLMMAMAIGVQMNKAQQSESSLMMENLEAIAMADTETIASGCWYTGNWFSECNSGMWTVTNCMPSSFSSCMY